MKNLHLTFWGDCAIVEVLDGAGMALSLTDKAA